MQLLRPRFDRAALLKRRDERKRYVPLYATAQGGADEPQASEGGGGGVSTLERLLPISQILLYRTLAAAHDRNKEKNEENWVDELLADAGLFGQGRTSPRPLSTVSTFDAQHASSLGCCTRVPTASGRRVQGPACRRPHALELNVGHVELALWEADGRRASPRRYPR